LPCDILLVPHPQLIDMAARLPDLRDPTACERASAGARQRLQARLDEEKAQR
jgi:hypothetical protein